MTHINLINLLCQIQPNFHWDIFKLIMQLYKLFQKCSTFALAICSSYQKLFRGISIFNCHKINLNVLMGQSVKNVPSGEEGHYLCRLFPGWRTFFFCQKGNKWKDHLLMDSMFYAILLFSSMRLQTYFVKS